MKAKQLTALFLCMLISATYGNGLMPLLPVYAVQLGADPALAGYFLAVIFLFLALGTFSGGWLSDHVQRRRDTIAVAAALWIPVSWATGRVSELWQFTVLTATVWFLAGIVTTQLYVIAGLFAGPSERGRVFGVLAAAGSLGSLIGGLTQGSIADRWGYAVLFVALALWTVLLVVLVGLFVEDRTVAPAPKRQSAAKDSAFGAGFYLLLVAQAAGTAASATGGLGRSLVMRQMGFAAADISSTMAAIGAVGLPLAPLLGRLSDRIGRRPVLALGYLFGSAGLWILSVSVALWQFQAGAAILGMIFTVGGSAGSALVADLVPPQSLGRGMSLYNASMWLGFMLGFAVMGNVVQALGGQVAFTLGALLALVSFVVVLRIRPLARRQPAAVDTARGG